MIGWGAVLRGGYVTWYGHTGIPGMNADLRWALAVTMLLAGIVQIWACLYERARPRAWSAVILTMDFTWVGGTYAAIPGIWHEPLSAVPIFYVLLLTGELWITARTPTLLPRAVRRRWGDRTSGPWPTAQ
jgi:hypothetical protein